MDKHNSYVLEKTFFAYGKYLRGEYLEKVRALILKDGKVAYIKDLETGKVSVPGGNVEDKETIEQAVIREVLEETGFEVKPIMPVGKEYYEVEMELGNINFISKRMSYIYLCEFISEKEKAKGLEGEYIGDIEVYFDNIEKLDSTNISKVSEEVIQRVNQYVEMYKK